MDCIHIAESESVVREHARLGLQYAIQMTALEIKKTVLNNLLIKGETVKAMELFYADNVTMQENEDEPSF